LHVRSLIWKLFHIFTKFAWYERNDTQTKLKNLTLFYQCNIPSCIYKHRELVSTNMLKYGIYMYGHVTYAIYENIKTMWINKINVNFSDVIRKQVRSK
jgi:hypothetical protein